MICNNQNDFIWGRRVLLEADKISTRIICSIYTNNLHSHFIHIRIRCRLDVWMFLSTSYYIIIPSKQRLCNILSFSVTCRIKDQRRDIISLQISNSDFPFVILTALYGLKLWLYKYKFYKLNLELSILILKTKKKDTEK